MKNFFVVIVYRPFKVPAWWLTVTSRWCDTSDFFCLYSPTGAQTQVNPSLLNRIFPGSLVSRPLVKRNEDPGYEGVSSPEPSVSFGHVVSETSGSGALSIQSEFPRYRSEIKWNGKCSGKNFRKFRTTFWANPKFRKIGITGKFRSIRPFLLGPSFSEAWIDTVNMAATPATQQICPLVVMFSHWHSTLGHRMNRPDRSTAACDTRFRTQSTLLSVISNLAATARVGSGLAMLHKKAYKTCLVGGIGACPDPLPSGILPVGMTSRVNSSQVSLVLRKWLLSSSGKYSGFVLWTRTLDLNFFAYNN